MKNYKSFTKMLEKVDLDEKTIRYIRFCIAQLISRYGFFANVLFHLRIKVSDKVKTMATDGKSIIINPKWTLKLTDDEVIFVLCHECMHCLLHHFARTGTRNHKLANYAQDYAINLLLTGIGVMPKKVLYDERFKDMGFEQIYDILYEEIKEHQKNNPPKPINRKGKKKKEETRVSVFEGSTNVKDESIVNILDSILLGEYEDDVKKLRRLYLSDKLTEYESLLKSLPYFTPAAGFSGDLDINNLRNTSNVIMLHVSNLTDSELKSVKDSISKIEGTYACFIDVSGTGLVVFVKTNMEIGSAFLYLKESYESKLGITFDDAGQKLTDTCYYSFDANIFISEEKGEEEEGEESEDGEQQEIDDMGEGEPIGEDVFEPGDLDDVGEQIYNSGSENLDKKSADQLKQEWQNIAREAASKSAGSGSAGIDRFLRELNKPKVNWKSELKRFVRNIYSKVGYKMPNKRYIHQDDYLYGIKATLTPSFDDVVIAIDTSGSIGEKELTKFVSEVKGIMDIYKIKNIHIIWCDSEIPSPGGVQSFVGTKFDVKYMKPTGGGGTSFIPPFEWIRDNILKKNKKPAFVIYFTDAESSDIPSKQLVKDYVDRIMWVIIDNSSADHIKVGKKIFLDRLQLK